MLSETGEGLFCSILLAYGRSSGSDFVIPEDGLFLTEHYAERYEVLLFATICRGVLRGGAARAPIGGKHSPRLRKSVVEIVAQTV